MHRWCSQPVFIRRVHSDDLLTTSAILFTGNSYMKFALQANFIKRPIVSSSTFHKMQRTYLIPTIDRFWKELQDQTLQDFERKEIFVLGREALYTTVICSVCKLMIILFNQAVISVFPYTRLI